MEERAADHRRRGVAGAHAGAAGGAGAGDGAARGCRRGAGDGKADRGGECRGTRRGVGVAAGGEDGCPRPVPTGGDLSRHCLSLRIHAGPQEP